MTELYAANRDAYVAGNIATGKVKPRMSYRAPAYTTEFTGGGGQTVDEYQATLARLAKLGAGVVTRTH